MHSSKVTRDLKNKLRHERNLKLDAFNQVDELVAQVRRYFFSLFIASFVVYIFTHTHTHSQVEEYTLQQSTNVRTSMHAVNRTPQLTASTPTMPGPSPNGKGGLASSSQGRGRPKSVVHVSQLFSVCVCLIRALLSDPIT